MPSIGKETDVFEYTTIHHVLSLTYVASYSILCSPEPHILLFRRPLGTDPQSGRVDPELERKAREEYRSQYGMARN